VIEMPVIAIDEQTKLCLDKVGRELATVQGVKSVSYEAIVYHLYELWASKNQPDEVTE
jgi:hypothetical protein